MGKTQYQNSNKSVNGRQADKTKKKSGRPSNDLIETAFLNTIRDVKLQIINAEAQLQLEMAFFTNQDEKKSRRKEEYSLLQKQAKIFQFNSLTSDQKKNLQENFYKWAKQWKFEQIDEQSDFPQYFFDDSNDLGYVLHELIKVRKGNVQGENSIFDVAKEQQKSKKIKAEEMFFLSLLCFKQLFDQFSSQESLRDVVLEFLLKNENLIINLLRASIQKARTKYIQKVKINKQNPKLINETEKNILIKTFQAPNLQSEHQLPSSSKHNSQKKKIQKPVQKYNPNIDHQIDSQDSQEPMTQKEKEEKLILCFVNYISWNYFYVYKEQANIIKHLKEQGRVTAEKKSS